VLAGLVIAAGLGAVPWLRAKRAALRLEAAAIRAGQPTDRTRLDSLETAVRAAQATLRLETARASARTEPRLHLVIAVDSGTVALMRDGMTLRTMSARFTGSPTRGTQTITRIAARPVESTAPVVDSLGTTIAAALADSTVERITLSDGTILEAGDASAVVLGGVDVLPGARTILLSRRDFAAIRPNLVKGMKAILF
jgi:hypothetical protein